MNPQYGNQYQGGYGPGFGTQPSGQRPPGPPPGSQNVYNGVGMGQRPPGPPVPGQFGNPMQAKGVTPGPPPGQFGQPGPMHNGPATGTHGPQGDQYGMPRPPGPGQSQRPMGPGSGPGYGGPQGPQRGPPPGATNQMTNQMGSMHLSGPPRGPHPMGNQGHPPSSMAGPPHSLAGPPNSMMGPPSSMAGPPQTMSGPPHAMSGPPSSMAGPPHSMAGPPNSMMGPPNSMAGPPQSMSGPPHAMSGPPSSMAGPPNSMMGQPSSYGPPSGTPQSGMGQHQMGGRGPPTGAGQMGGQPSSMAGPPSSMAGPPSGYGPPPGPMGGHPQGSLGSHSGPMNMGPPSGPGNTGPPSGPMGMTQPGMIGMEPSQNQYNYNNPPGGQPGMPPQPGGPPPPMGGQFPPGPGQGQYMGGQPSPGYGQQGFNYGTNQGQRPMSQPPQKKLDPNQMPSPIQVIEDDKINKSGMFQLQGRGIVPPLVTTEFFTQDQGNSNPRYLRSTMYNVPCTSDMMKSSQIPFGLTITPFARIHESEHPPPIINLGEIGPVRCKRCKAYMNPNMQFIDGGRRFQCVFCGAATEVPQEYFNHLDHTGRRVDCYDRPELCLGSYEFVATKDYCKNGVLPKSPAFIFMIDVSYNSVKSGLVHLICQHLKDDVLVNLPREIGAEESEVQVGFVTYSKELHFYNVKSSLAQPQMLVVSDLEDVFVPLLDGFLVNLSESEAVIDSLLSQIPGMFAESRETEIVLGPVIQAGLDALKSAERAGKLFIFHSSLPIAEAPGKLKNRDDRKLLGTEKEKTILTPQGNFYTKLGQECVAAGCCVDLFLFPNSYMDLASIGEVPRLTGGNVYKYNYFQADLEGERFLSDLKRTVGRPIAFDAILRVRTSTGIRPVDFYGNFYMSNTTDVELSAIDCDQAVAVEIKHDDKLNETEGAYIQVATLYTSVSGQRRLRIHNLALNCCTQMADLFRNCELDTMINLMAKQAIRNVLNHNPKHVREEVMTQVSNILACYRKNCASPSSAGQLILPECMKLLPLYSNCILKSDGIQGGSDISTDDRSYLMLMINSMNVRSSQVFFYPRLLPLHDLDEDGDSMPSAIRCSVDRLQEDGVYLLENGVSMFMWIGHNASPEWIQNVFGVQSAAQVDIDKCTLLVLDNPLSKRINGIIQKIRAERSRYMKLTVVRQRDKLEPWFNHFLVEDKGLSGSASYVDFLCHIHKEIRNLLS